MHPNSVLLFRNYALNQFSDGSRVLEIGPDDDPSTFRREVRVSTKWTTADLASEVGEEGGRRWGGGAVHLGMPSEYEIPAEDDAFDVVLSGQVIEHVRRPWKWMAELARVCSPGGVVITVNPVSWPYHEAPIDCWRIFPEGMTALCSEVGLAVELSRCESLEPKPRRWYPGQSHGSGLGRKAQLLDRAASAIGWPVPVAFDTITVARCPTTET